MRILIENGHVIDPASNIDGAATVAIVDGKIQAVGTKPEGFQADHTINAVGQIVCPGFVDLRARLREPGLEYKATIESETIAAAASGITTVCCPPDTMPVIDTPAVAELIYQRALAVSKARVVCVGALTRGLEGRFISEMKALAEAGCVGVGNAHLPIKNTLILRRAMEYAASHELTLFLQSEDAWLAAHGIAHEGAISTRMGLAGIPEIAETIAVARDLALVRHTGVRAHFGCLSSAGAVEMIARAQDEGLAVTADVSVYHLHLTDMDLAEFNSYCHVRPPLRTQRDRSSLRAALVSGTIGTITSDHQPHDIDAKLGPLDGTEPGISGLDTLLPLSLRLVKEGVLSMQQLITRMTINPATVLGLPIGRLSVGAPADICIFNPMHEWKITAQNLKSRGHNTPFIGWDVAGKVNTTLLNGQVVYSSQPMTE